MINDERRRRRGPAISRSRPARSCNFSYLRKTPREGVRVYRPLAVYARLRNLGDREHPVLYKQRFAFTSLAECVTSVTPASVSQSSDVDIFLRDAALLSVLASGFVCAG